MWVPRWEWWIPGPISTWVLESADLVLFVLLVCCLSILCLSRVCCLSLVCPFFVLCVSCLCEAMSTRLKNNYGTRGALGRRGWSGCSGAIAQICFPNAKMATKRPALPALPNDKPRRSRPRRLLLQPLWPQGAAALPGCCCCCRS